MCGRYTLAKPIQTLKSHFSPVHIYLEYFPNYNIAPGQISPIVTNRSNQLEMLEMKWGLIPSWSKDEKISRNLINARSETIHEKPSFRNSFKSQRCLIPADSFIEWKGKEKQPYCIRMKSQGLFAFAGLWSTWDSGDSSMNTFIIITTEANAKLSPLHSRMPVILHPENYTAWLSPASALESLTSFFSPYPDNELEYFEISKDTNSTRNNRPNLLQPAGQTSITFS